jgi:hypothetical protein
MARRRIIERAVKVPESPWERLLRESEQFNRERAPLGVACQLDAEGRYTEADAVLRDAGIDEDLISDRRRHLEWRRANGFNVTGDTLTKVKPEGDSQ